MLFHLKNCIIELYIWIKKGVVCITKFYVKGEFITLTQFLKELSYISSGGEAKFFLQEAKILVNNEPENRRGKKLYPGDFVNVEGDEFELIQAI